MAVTIKTEEDVAILREAGKRLARVMEMLAAAATPGVSIEELDQKGEEMIRANGDVPALLNYKPWGAERPFPASVCISVNNEVVHGVPNENPHVLKEGDLVSFDACLNHKERIADMAITVGVGSVDKNAERLMQATRKALAAAIDAARGGNHLGDIGAAIDAIAQKYGYGNVYEFGGHGVGYAVHEKPFVMNVGEPGTGEELMPGMVLALEPMFTEGGERIKILEDGYTVVTRDGSRAAHFEHSILITNGEAEILTKSS